MKILTGSREFFSESSSKDSDFIEFLKQDELFAYTRDESKKTCTFKYKKGLKKEEYFIWLEKENKWLLNFAPLITKKFLEAVDIDILGVDKERVYGIMKRYFSLAYKVVEGNALSKYVYRFYIYQQFIENGSFVLTEEQLATALDIKKKKYCKEVVKSLYDFFDEGVYFDWLTDNIKFK